MNSILIITAGLVFAVNGCGPYRRYEPKFKTSNDDNEDRIIQGKVAVNHSRPWMVYVDGPTTMSCGGALIDPRWVLTAAHCVYKKGEKYKAVAGTNQVCEEEEGEKYEDFGDEAEERNVIAVYMNNFSNKTNQNDIALIKVDRPFPITKNIKTIPLASKAYAPGDKLEFSGWGDTYAGQRDNECLLRTVKLPLVSNKECKDDLGRFFKKTELCAGYKDGSKSACNGDSGGPLVDLKGPALVGIFSMAGVNCDTYNIFSKVKHYSDWIEETMKK